MTMREQVAALHAQGMGTKRIAEILGITKASVSYHKKMLGVLHDRHDNIDWASVAADVEQGMKRKAILVKYKIGSQRLTNAIDKGLVPSRAKAKFDPAIHLAEHSPFNRGTIKRYLLEQGLLENTCALCPQGPEWNGKPLVLALDHENGISNDNRLSNLRLLCPNCHSQTETFAGRNTRKT